MTLPDTGGFFWARHILKPFAIMYKELENLLKLRKQGRYFLRSGTRLHHLSTCPCALSSWNYWNLCKILADDWHSLCGCLMYVGSSLSFTFYLICGSLSLSFEVKQIYQPVNKQELGWNDKIVAKGSHTFFTLTSVCLFALSSSLNEILPGLGRAFILTCPFSIVPFRLKASLWWNVKEL